MSFSTELGNLESVQSRKWLVTINNPLEHGYGHERIQEIMSHVKGASLYWCMCDEEGDECETLHTHIFLFRTSPFSAKTSRQDLDLSYLYKS